MPLELPARIGKYELEKFLGGGMSHVYRARDTVIGRTVAIKILTEEGCADEDTRTRFLLEARLAGSIEHENVITIHDFGEDEQKRPYMVMEFLRGEDLREAIKAEHTGDLTNKLRIARQIASALGYIHEKKIVHRDIKPENIQVTPNGLVKLMDFGIAKAAGLSMTRAGFVMGTPYYMSPEQVRGDEVDERVDIYSFGILLFELLCGKRPFIGDSIELIFFAILSKNVDTQLLEDAGVPQQVRDLVCKCTAKERSSRPAGFSFVMKELDFLIASYEAQPPVALKTVTLTAPTLEIEEASSGLKRKLMLAAIAVLLIAALGVGYLLVSRRSRPIQSETTKNVEAPVRLKATLATSTGEMVLVSAGSFRYGKEETPVTLPAFYIDQTEVPNADYLAFSQATGHPLPPDFPTDKPKYPVVNVTIADARQYSAWAGKSLPTDQQWEKAARGLDGRIYPWGREADATRANVSDNRKLTRHELMPVHSFTNGESPFKVLQMVGNVWEFVDGGVTPSASVIASFAKTLKPPPGPEEKWFQIRGESYQEPLASEVMFDGSSVPERWKHPTAGFRCIKLP